MDLVYLGLADEYHKEKRKLSSRLMFYLLLNVSPLAAVTEHKSLSDHSSRRRHQLFFSSFCKISHSCV